MKLDNTKQHQLRHLYISPTEFDLTPAAYTDSGEVYANILHELVSLNYLGQMKNHHAFGHIKDDVITSMVGFYESTDDASCYVTHIRYDNQNDVKYVIDEAIEFMESRGRAKFYTVLPTDLGEDFNAILLSERNAVRYNWHDEFRVTAKEQCIYNFPWKILYVGTLCDRDTYVRCFSLKQEYRNNINGGNL